MSAGETCLLTGASGFIGGHLARRLADQGRQVRCLVRPGAAVAPLAAVGAEPIEGDLTRPDSLAAAAAGCDVVVHCAALVSDWGTVAEIERVNVAGTRDLAAAAAAAAVRRFVHVSTTDVYGHPGGPAVGEDAVGATPPRNWYARTKLAAEEELRRVAAGSGMETVVVRPATVYGPGSVAVVGEIAAALRGGNMLLIDGGRALAGLCFVENLADLLLLALDSEAAAGEAFNADDGLAVTWRRFVDDLAAGLGVPPARWSAPYRPARALAVVIEEGYRVLRRATGLSTRPLLSRQAVEVLGRPQSFSSRRARELLGWEPRVGYEVGLERTLDWLRGE
ncbi:MAG TPA: NAD-dependent epimerase/dehydratase family protein [Solirubrobacterales bacterium]|nr:NAD-dependent epimerase/dehydratase family protein [Solirubrobacterales bacterium]